MIAHFVLESAITADESSMSVNDSCFCAVVPCEAREISPQNSTLPAVVKNVVVTVRQQKQQQHDDDTAAPGETIDISSICTIGAFTMDPFVQYDGEITAIRKHFQFGDDIVFHDSPQKAPKPTFTMTTTAPVAPPAPTRISFERDEIDDDERSVDSIPRVPPPPPPSPPTVRAAAHSTPRDTSIAPKPWTAEEDACLRNVVSSRKDDHTGNPKFWAAVSICHFKGDRAPEECRQRYFAMLAAAQAEQRQEEAERLRRQEEEEAALDAQFGEQYRQREFEMESEFFSNENWLDFDESTPALDKRLQEHQEYLERGYEMELEFFSDDSWMDY
jgi:hypothetical protein